MYITEVVLHNYRAYKHEVIPIAKGLNVVWGDGDAGKSALVKGIAWALLNAPQSNYINKKIKTAKGNIKSSEIVYAHVTFDTGDIIVRESDSSTPNIYRIGHVDTPKEDWVELKNFGNGIPEPVQTVINLSDLNLQKQFDSHFLLASKSSDVAKELNKMVNLEIIDSSTTKINKEVALTKKKKEADEFSVKELSVELESYRFLNDVEEMLGKIETISEKVGSNKSALQQITDSVTKCSAITKEIVQLQPYIEAKALCKSYTALGKELDSKVTSSNKIKARVAEMQQIKVQHTNATHIMSAKKLIERLSDTSIKQTKLTQYYDKLVCMLESLRSYNINIFAFRKMAKHRILAEKTMEARTTAHNLRIKYDKIANRIDSVEDNKTEMDILKNSIAENLKQIGDVCPYCGNKLKEAAIETNNNR